MWSVHDLFKIIYHISKRLFASAQHKHFPLNSTTLNHKTKKNKNENRLKI